MAADTITFSYTRVDGGEVVSVSVKGQDFGSDEVWSRRQVVGKTLGNTVYVYDLGKEELELNVQLNMLTATERADLEWFFSENNVNLCKRWFKVDVPAPVKSVVLVTGGAVGGVSIGTGTTYKAGQRVKLDVVRYYARLVTPSLSFVEPVEGFYSTTMTLRVLFGFLPDNNC